MNLTAKHLVTALAASIIAAAGTACATTSDMTPNAANPASDTASNSARPAATSGTRTVQPLLPQNANGLAATPGTSDSTTAAPAAGNAPSTPLSSSTPAGTSAEATGATANTTATQGQGTEARRIFDQLDLNHDGVLSYQEFSRATFETK